MTTKKKVLIGAGILGAGAGVGVMMFLALPICWGDIPSCSSCELDYAAPTSNATGKFTCLASKFKQADVVTDFGATPMSVMPTLNNTFNQSVGTSSRPSTAYIQLKYQDSSGFWQNGRTMTLTIRP
jgi:hypothetical protein